MKTITIDRSRWVPGGHRGSSYSTLLSALGKTCCLGELGLGLGATWDALINRNFPSNNRNACEWPERLFHGSWFVEKSGIQERIVRPWQAVFTVINDYRCIDDETREAWVAAGFEIVLGCKVRYAGKYTDGPRGDNGELKELLL